MLPHWLGSQEGFNINWWKVFRTFLNSLKNLFKNLYQTKSKVQMWQKYYKKNLLIFFPTNKYFDQIFPFIFWYFHILMKFRTKVNVELHIGIVSSNTMHVQSHVLHIPLNVMQIHYTQSMKIVSFQICYKCYLTFKYANNNFLHLEL